MSRYWNPLLDSLRPYTPGEQPKQQLLKLNTNECPYGPSPLAKAAISQATDDSLRLYPDPENLALCRAWAEIHGLDVEQVFVGNGSDEVLAHTFVALLKHDSELLFPDISYSFYPVYCGLFDIAYRTVSLNDDFTLDPSRFGGNCGGIIFPNPNAPTGITLPLDAVRLILESHPDVVVVVDEAYIDFGGESAVCLINDYDNLLVIQTLSKSRALAGLRVGAAFGDKALIEGLKRVKNSFNSYPVGRLAEAGAIAALQDTEYFDKLCQRTITDRDRLTTNMEEMGFTVLPSGANFVFARHSNRSAPELFAQLRERGILVRHFSQPGIEEWLRISIGTTADCEQLQLSLRAILV
jgi:histidinol-phosphate aminotransferase